jgi:AcrR family transcriptional regulator
VVANAKRTERTNRRTTDKAIATRAALVELAAELFAEGGYQQTSIRDITRAASLTSGAIYGHFRNKAELLAAAISLRTSTDLERAYRLAPNVPQQHVEVLRRLTRRYPERRQLRALILQAAAAAPTDPEARDRVREEQMEHLQAWIDGYEASRADLGIDPEQISASIGQWTCTTQCSTRGRPSSGSACSKRSASPPVRRRGGRTWRHASAARSPCLQRTTVHPARAVIRLGMDETAKALLGPGRSALRSTPGQPRRDPPGRWSNAARGAVTDALAGPVGLRRVDAARRNDVMVRRCRLDGRTGRTGWVWPPFVRGERHGEGATTGGGDRHERRAT